MFTVTRVVEASPHNFDVRGLSVDGDSEPVVSKEEVTRNAASNERGSMEVPRGRGGTRAASMPRRRGERGQALLVHV
jgi:hypothetical protein